MSRDEFAKLFTYMQERFNRVDHRFDEAAAVRADIRASVAENGARIKENKQEIIVLNHAVSRSEKWIQQIASKIGVDLKY
ncbi:MAG: hypothetical protein R3313_02215 [Candidatus Saccharimonadales bacterium]|nr:hypothetical protein [Candidatus Saccharimonadales bacterium]